MLDVHFLRSPSAVDRQNMLGCLQPDTVQGLVNDDRLAVFVLHRIAVPVAEELRLRRLHRLVQNREGLRLRGADVVGDVLRVRPLLLLQRSEKRTALLADDPLDLIRGNAAVVGDLLAPRLVRVPGFRAVPLVRLQDVDADNRRDLGRSFSHE